MKRCQLIQSENVILGEDIVGLNLREIGALKVTRRGSLIGFLTIFSVVLVGAFLGSSVSHAEARSYRFVLRETNGRMLTMERLRGRRVFMDVWAIWCAPCLVNLPTVQKLSHEFSGRPGVAIVSVHSGEDYGRYRDVADFLKQNKYTFEVALDPNSLATKQLGRFPGIISLPKYILFDEEGRIVRRFSQLDPQSVAEIRRYLSNK